MNVKSLAHAGFRVKNMEESFKFYIDGLGFKHKFTMYRQKGDVNPWIEYLEFGDHQFVELFHCREEKKPHPDLREYYSIHHIALIVDDIHAAFKEAKEKGLHIKTEPLLGPDNTWQFWLIDPDGNEIEMMEYTNDSLQLVERDV